MYRGDGGVSIQSVIQPGASLSAAAWGCVVDGLIIARMVINMDETRLCTIAQLEEFPSATQQVAFSAHDAGDAGDNQRGQLLQRACGVFGDSRFERLAQLSVSPLYNLRKKSISRASGSRHCDRLPVKDYW